MDDGQLAVFIEVMRPPQPLVIFGEGNDIAPLVQFARQLGWHITIVPAASSASRFTGADVVLPATTESPDGNVAIDSTTAAVVMTHNYPRDRQLLEKLIKSPARYIGILGPKRRTEKLLSELNTHGSLSVGFNRIRSPIGLDIGAETPSEIALAILAEIQSVLKDRPGGFAVQRAATQADSFRRLHPRAAKTLPHQFMPRVAALILAAGGSTRMGSPKQLLSIGNHSLIRHVVGVAISAGCSPIRVVLGAQSETIIKQLDIPNLQVLPNEQWQKGIGTSIRAGMQPLPPTIDALIILLCDQPLITSDHLRALIAAHEQQQKPLCACLYPDGSAGPPALFAKSYFDQLEALPDDAGRWAAHPLAQNPADLATIPIPEAAVDLDTPEDYQRLQSLNDPMIQ